MAELAKHIVVKQRHEGKPGSIKIDGQEFPWYTVDAVTARVGPARRKEEGVTSLATVTVEIPCEHFEFVDPWPDTTPRGEIPTA